MQISNETRFELPCLTSPKCILSAVVTTDTYYAPFPPALIQSLSMLLTQTNFLCSQTKQFQLSNFQKIHISNATRFDLINCLSCNLFGFSRMCVFSKWVLIWLAQEGMYSHWLHLFKIWIGKLSSSPWLKLNTAAELSSPVTCYHW